MDGEPSLELPRHLSPRPHRHAHRRHVRGFRLLSRALAVVVAIGATLTAVAFLFAWHYESQIHRLTLRELRKQPGAENFLLVGSDTRSGVGTGFGSAEKLAGQRADTIILAHLPANRATPTLVSFPRDSYVQIPAYRDPAGHNHPPQMNKLNAAYALGGPQFGPQLLVNTVEAISGLPIAHYVEVNFAGFERMVNAVGGVTLCAKTSRHDPANGPQGGSNDFMTAGIHRDVNGAVALAFVRDRHSFPDQDVSRIHDEQYFLAQMTKKVLNAGTLLNPLKLNGFLNAATTSITTDQSLTLGDLRTLTARLRHLDPGHTRFVTLPFLTSSASRPIGGAEQSVIELDPVADARLFASFSAAGRPVDTRLAGLTITVLNATLRPGLAGATATSLSARGARVDRIGDAPSSSRTSIVYTSDQAGNAAALDAQIDPQPILRPAAGSAVLRLVLGGDFRRVTTPGRPAGQNRDTTPRSSRLGASASELTCGA